MPPIRTLKYIHWDLSLDNFYNNTKKIPSVLKSDTTKIALVSLFVFIIAPLINVFYIFDDYVVRPLIVSLPVRVFYRIPVNNNQLKSIIVGFISIALIYSGIILAITFRKENKILSLLAFFESFLFMFEAHCLSRVYPHGSIWWIHLDINLYLIIGGSILVTIIIFNYLLFYIKRRKENRKILEGNIPDLF